MNKRISKKRLTREKNKDDCAQQLKTGNLPPYNNKITGQLIRQLRIKHGISQEVLSGFASIARSHLSAIENGSKNPNVETLWRIADALEMPLSRFILFVEDAIKQSENKK